MASPVELADVGPNEMLLDYLRLREKADGTKEGCNEGDCGACTVAVCRPRDGRLVYEPVNACIRLLAPSMAAMLSPSTTLPRMASCTRCNRPWSTITARNAASARRASS